MHSFDGVFFRHVDKKSQGRRNIYRLEHNPIDLWLDFKDHMIPFYKKIMRITSQVYL